MNIRQTLVTTFRILGVAALVLAAGCADKKAKKSGVDLTDTIGGVGLPSRPDFNPDTDVNYQILKPFTVYFGFDSNIIKSDQRAKLMKVYEWMEAHPGKMILLAGHTDDRGTLEYNRGLGERRALAVRDYLLGLGADPAMIHTLSYGEERPASTGSTESDYAKNRRVQVGVVEK